MTNSTLEEIQQIFNEQHYIEEAEKENYSKEMIEDDMDQFFSEFNYDNTLVKFCWDEKESGTLNVYGKADDGSWKSIKIVFQHLQ